MAAYGRIFSQPQPETHDKELSFLESLERIEDIFARNPSLVDSSIIQRQLVRLHWLTQKLEPDLSHSLNMKPLLNVKRFSLIGIKEMDNEVKDLLGDFDGTEGFDELFF